LPFLSTVKKSAIEYPPVPSISFLTSLKRSLSSSAEAVQTSKSSSPSSLKIKSRII